MVDRVLRDRLALAGLQAGLRGSALESVERELCARYVLRGGASVIDVLGEALDLPLTAPINRAAAAHGCSALHLGPDEWLLLVDAERAVA